MTKTKLLTEGAKIHSSLTKDINRLKKNTYLLERKCKDYKILVKQTDKLFKIMLKDGRLSKSELSKYFKKRGTSY